MQYPRNEGGLSLYDLELYHKAAQLFYIDRIVNNTNEEPWIDIENHQLQPTNLLLALFSKKKVKTANFLIKSTINAWKKVKKILGQEIDLPLNIQIWNNPSVTIQNSQLQWNTWMKCGIHNLSDMVNNNSLLSFQELKDKYKLKNTEFFRYLQLRSWLTENFDIGKGASTEIGEILNKRGKKKRLLGNVYDILIKATSNEEQLQKIYNYWNKDLEILDAKTKWKECLLLTYQVTTNENLRLIQYKLMTRIYYSRDKIHKFDTSSSDLCLKCGKQSDSLIHAFWYCEKIRKTWEDIEKWLAIVCKTNVVLSPVTCIFQSMGGVRYPTTWQILFSSLVFKKLILQHWKDTECPTIVHWKNLMKYYLNMERAIMEDNNKEKYFLQVWSLIYDSL